ncbi:kinetochor protein Mis14/NSL1 [Sporothrix schenckii 1099-18]|uniref:Kinetochor protein Mis14/NSL1 n=1 Tax=Sporothrix schenckii 1099-18 TaxID=1397361 RepID=A0A0F2LR22_SPOSC|nr:kinetochor protein Mis14/NSL1 [Sporothrix schenckii 1099-18]KJR79983.1 kinetochor protein Mis14/NSL1 [Sporothrix schenckii 1099-18]
MEASHHRKIELQAPEDFAYLVDNVRRAAADSVAAAFPPVANDDDNDKKNGKNGKKKKRVDEGDDLHARVEVLVNEYIRRAFALAAPNLTINGLPVDPAPFWDDDDDDDDDDDESAAGSKSKKGKKGKKNQAPVEETEPFDTRKRQRVEDLSRDEEDLLRDIALLKRRVPAAAVRAREQALARQLAADDAAAAALQEVLQQQQDEAAAAAREEAEAEAANNTTASNAESFSQAVAGLGRLKQAMPATVARMERARIASDYAVAER